MTYDLVVRQKLDLMLSEGYSGSELQWVEEVCRRGAIVSLLMQSTTGQCPFGGRSNQFHFVEAHFACLCECRARYYHARGQAALAGAFKRAGRRAIAMTRPWVTGIQPFRHTKQGFLPSLEHGVDSGGYYSVYGLLMASLCATAYHLADDNIPEVITPAELGGYVLQLSPAFHKVFATCAGYHMQIDTRADLSKDATGLGRFHHEGAWPETALSMPITATPTYSFCFQTPLRNMAIGPAWLDAEGNQHRLADFSDEIEQVTLVVHQQTPGHVAFDLHYTGDMAGVRSIRESCDLTADGLSYAVALSPTPAAVWITVPAIRTDGDAESLDRSDDRCVRIEYRGWVFEVVGPCPQRASDPPAANRNALYDTYSVPADHVRLRLSAAPPASGRPADRQRRNEL